MCSASTFEERDRCGENPRAPLRYQIPARGPNSASCDARVGRQYVVRIMQPACALQPPAVSSRAVALLYKSKAMLLRSGCRTQTALPSGAVRLRARRGVPRHPSQHRVTRASGGAEALPVQRRAALAAAAASCSAALLTSLAARCAVNVDGCFRGL